MNLQHRINLLTRLGNYMLSENENWQQVKKKATQQNSWFIPEFTDLAVKNIARQFLDINGLTAWTNQYQIPDTNHYPKRIGIVMAGNIPLAGFHDLICVFITGHIAVIKPSSKDEVLIKHLVKILASWNDEIHNLASFAERLTSCDAYIATGSNNSAGYFEFYFGKYPHIIRKNRTSIAILDGQESIDDLDKLADDVYLFFGLGCRNVTKLYVPVEYDFIPLLQAFKKYNYLASLHKYKNNYDYNLSLLLLNKKTYMSNESVLLSENISLYSPIGQLNYEYYNSVDDLTILFTNNEALQCIVGKNHITFGQAQSPGLSDYSDGVDTIKFLLGL